MIIDLSIQECTPLLLFCKGGTLKGRRPEAVHKFNLPGPSAQVRRGEQQRLEPIPFLFGKAAHFYSVTICILYRMIPLDGGHTLSFS